MPNCCITPGSEAVGFHAAKFKRRTFILVEIRQNRRGLHGLGGEPQRRRRANGPTISGTGAPSSVNRRLADAIVGAGAIDILLNDLHQRSLARPDCVMQLGDGRLFQLKCCILLFYRHLAASDGL